MELSFIEADKHVRADFKKRRVAVVTGPVLEVRGDSARPWVVPIPKEVATTPPDIHDVIVEMGS
jgi:hypothetical protein